MPDTPFSPEYDLGQPTQSELRPAQKPQGTQRVLESIGQALEQSAEAAIQREMAALPSGKPYRVVIRKKLAQ